MEGTGTRWLVTLCLLTAAQCIPSRVTSQLETDSEDSRRVLGSSVVTSVSVIMDHGNGTKTYFADGQSKNVHKPNDAIIGSPGNLMSPDRYEFYTFDETGDLVKRLMTLDEIHGLIAGADPDSVMADASPTYYHDALSSHSSEALMHLPASDLESLDAPAVHKVLESVQNVLKNEMAASSGKPVPPMSGGASLHRPESASAWSALFPGLIETPDDVAHLSGYLLPSKTTESTEKPSVKKPLTSTKIPLTSMQPLSTTVQLLSSSSSSIKTQSTTTTEQVRSTPKYTTAKPESTTKFDQIYSSTFKPSTAKKPFRPVQSFEKQKPGQQKPNVIFNPTGKPSGMADSLDINNEMSASISDMLSQVTDSQSSNHKPLQTNTLVEKDNADYVPEESSPELSYYSPVAMSLSTGALKPVTEALTSAKRPPVTMSLKTVATELPYSQKTTSTSTRFGPSKYNTTKPRPPANVTTTSSLMTKLPSYNKYNGSSSATTVSTTRNNYQYPPSNMSTKYMQKITQTTQVYPNKLIDPYVKVVNKTINNTTVTANQPPTEAFWNSTEEPKNKYTVKESTKVFPQNKVTSARPNVGVNRTNVTLSNRIQESKTTAAPSPSFGYGFSTTTIRSQTEPDKFVSVKVEGWSPAVAAQQQPTAVPSSTASYASTEKSFFSTNSQPLNAITNVNAIRDLISSLMTKQTTTVSSPVSSSTPSPSTQSSSITSSSTTAPSTTSPSTTSPSTTSPSTMSLSTTLQSTTSSSTIPASTTGYADQTLTAAISTTTPTVVKTVTGIPVSMLSSTTGTPTAALTATAVSSTTASSTTAAITTTTPTTVTTEPTATTSTTTEPAVTMTEPTATTAAASTATVSLAAITAASLTTVTVASSASATASARITTTPATATATPESETQYVPVTHFLPELQVKDGPETEPHQQQQQQQNNSTPGVDPMLKDGISAVANMLQNTQKPTVLSDAEYHGEETSKRPYEKVVQPADSKQPSTEQARKQATVKSDFEDATATTPEGAVTQDLYEFTTTEPTATTRYPEPNNNDTTTAAGDGMLTVFNVSSAGGSVQAPKLADLTADTQYSETTTMSFESRATESLATTVVTDEPLPSATAIPAAVSDAPNATAVPEVTRAPTQVTASNVTADATVAGPTGTANATAATPAYPAAAVKSPGPSSNAYRPPAASGASPSTVELHPAPHESMGLEASTAFLGDDVRRFADLCNELSFKMWTAVTGKGQIASRSLVLSPFELTAMLAMVFLGARGSTSGQMNDVLRLDDMVTFNPHQVLRNVTHSIANANNPGVATASFVREIYSHKGNGKILDFYKERVQQYYDGHVEEVDFNTIGDVLRRRTNLLVKRQTMGRVVEYLRGSGLSLTPPFAAFSANVFQTSCESASTEGRDGEMYFVVRPSTRQRRLVPVPAAVWRGGFLAGYEPGLDATAVCLSPDSAVSTILVLPGQQGQVAPGDGLARLEQRLIETSYRRGGWSRVLRSLLPRPGLELQVPRFSHRSVLNATAALQKMGLRDVFNDQKADLRGVNGLYDLYLSDMLQVNTFSTCGEDVIGARHHVETYPASPQRMGRVQQMSPSGHWTDQHDGGEASRTKRAAPAADPSLYSPYSHLPLNLRPRQARLPDVPRLRFDRPFLYLVRHNPTGMIVYLGRFNPRLLP